MQQDPRHRFYQDISYILNHHPAGSLRPDQVAFCHDAIERLSKQPQHCSRPQQHSSYNNNNNNKSQNTTNVSPLPLDVIFGDICLAEELVERLAHEVHARVERYDVEQQEAEKRDGQPQGDNTTATVTVSMPQPNQQRQDMFCFQMREILPTRCYIHVMMAWAQSRDARALNRVVNLLTRLEQRHDELPQCFNGPAHSAYSALLRTCALWEVPADQASKVALQTMTRLEQKVAAALANNNNTCKPLPAHLYRSWILAHVHRAPHEYGAAAQAEDALLQFSKAAAAGWVVPGPTTQAFHCVMAAWIASPDDLALTRVATIVKLMMSLHQTQPQVAPTPETFYRLISAHGLRQEPQKAQNVFRLAIQHLISSVTAAQASVSPQQSPGEAAGDDDDVGDDNKNHSAGEDSFTMDGNILNQNEVWEEKSVSLQKPVDLTDCFNAMLLAWVTSDDPDADQVVEQWFVQELPQLAKDNNDIMTIRPNAKSYESRLNVHMHRGHVERADSILRQLAQEQLAALLSTPSPVAATATTAVTTKSDNAKDTASTCSPVITTRLFYGVMQAWLRKPSVANEPPIHRARHMVTLLDKLLELHATDTHRRACEPSPAMFTMCVQASCNEGNVSLALEILKKAVRHKATQKHAYGCIIEKLCDKNQKVYTLNNNNNKQGGQVDTTEDVQKANVLLAADLLDQMKTNRAEAFDHGHGLYAKVISALGRVVGTLAAAQRAEVLLHQLPKESTTALLFTTVMNAYARVAGQQHETVVPKVMSLLDKMLMLDKHPGSPVRCDELAFYTVFGSLLAASTNASSHKERQTLAHHAQKVLTHMLGLFQKHGRFELRPTTRCWDACLAVMSQAYQVNEAIALLRLLPVCSVDPNHVPSAKAFFAMAAARRRCCQQTGPSQERDELAEHLEAMARYAASECFLK